MPDHPRYIDRMSAMALLTADDLERLNLPNKRTELVRGALIVLSAGCRLVWVVDPARRSERVHRANGAVLPLTDADAFDGEDVVPGFSCPVEDLLR